MITLLEGILATFCFDHYDGSSEQENEIYFLRKMLKENNSKEEDPGLVQLYKTALRIALARRKWVREAAPYKKYFYQNFRLGFRKKKVMNIYYAGDCWFSDPGNYACALHNVLARIPEKTHEIEW